MIWGGLLPTVAHAGPGSTWQAAVVVFSLGLTICVILSVLGRIPMETAEDLLVPLAGSAVIASIGPLGAVLISDGIGWGLPLGVVALLALLLAALTPLRLDPASPLTLGSLALAMVSIVVLYQPLTVALHPPPDLLPLADDSEIAIVEPSDGATITAGDVEVVLEVTGGSFGPPLSDLADLSIDPEEAGAVAVFIDGDRVPVDWDGCTISDPCSTISFDVPFAEGERILAVEFVRGDGVPFAPTVIDRATLTVE